MAIFLKCEGWKGDVDADQYKEWVMCHSFQFGVENDIRTALLVSSNRSGTHATVSEVTLTKGLDPASPRIFLDSVSGSIRPRVEIAFTLADHSNTAYLHIRLDEVGVSKWSLSSTGERPSEVISLAFARIELAEVTQAKSGQIADRIVARYDLSHQRAG